MSVASENRPPASGLLARLARIWSSRQASIVRLVLALAVTVTLLPYNWSRTLVVYSQWNQVEWGFLGQMVVGLIATIVLNFHLASKLPKRLTIAALIAVCVLWTSFAVYLIVAYNGDALPGWLVFAGFYPATLWVAWVAWMFMARIRWSVRLSVLGVLLLAMVPYLRFFEVRGLTGDGRPNFALRTAQHADADIVTSVGELTKGSIKLVGDAKTDFPAFQGPSRTAVLSGLTLDRDWSQHPPKELWRVPVGAGWGSFAVVGKYAFTQEQRGEDECIVCRELATGREVWAHKDKAPYNGKPRYEGMGGPGPRSTPTVSDGRVYTVGATGIFNCLDGTTGHLLWTKNIVEENGGSIAFHGVCGSPLIVNDLVIVAPTGKPEISLAAYNRLTGELVWRDGIDSAGYSSPMLASVGGLEQILNYTQDGITAHDPAKGKVLWHYEWHNPEHEISSQPIANAGAPDQVLLTTGYGKGSVLLQVAKGTDGNWSVKHLWQNATMKTKFTTAVRHNGFVYGLDDGIMQCIDLATGKQKWKGGRFGHGQILLVGDLIVVQTERGQVVLVEANPQRLKQLGEIPALSSKTWNAPTLAGKHLLVRNDQEAVCYEIALSSK